MLYTIARWFFRLVINVLFRLDVTVEEPLPKKGALVLCSNHISWWDPVVIACAVDRPLHFMAKKELFEYPIFGRLLRMVHAFPVDRGKPDIRAIRAGLDILRNEEVVAVFPEGTRQRGKEKLGEAHAGAALLALKCNVPVVPCAVRSQYKIGNKIKLAMGRPFYLTRTEGKLSSELDSGARQIMDAIARLWEKMGT